MAGSGRGGRIRPWVMAMPSANDSRDRNTSGGDRNSAKGLRSSGRASSSSRLWWRGKERDLGCQELGSRNQHRRQWTSVSEGMRVDRALGSPRCEDRRRSWERRGGQTHRGNEAVCGCVEEQTERNRQGEGQGRHEYFQSCLRRKGVTLLCPHMVRWSPETT